MLWILLSLVVFFLLVVVPYGLSWLIVNGSYHFPDPDSGKTPASFGVPFEDVEFSSEPGIQIRGWYVPALDVKGSAPSVATSGPRGTVILVHGLNRTRVEMLTRAIFLSKAGYNGLLFDLRHHGVSGGKVSSLGYYESHDVRASLDFLKSRKDVHGPFALWGVSMGATASLLAFAGNPEFSCVIADSPFLSFEDTIVHHAHLLLHLPRFPIVDLILFITSHRLGFRMGDFDLRNTVREIGPRPILFVAGTADQRMPPEIAKALFEIASSPQKRLLLVEGAKHGGAYREDPATYEQVVLRFFQTTLKPHPNGPLGP